MELLDLPGQPLPPASTPLPVRCSPAGTSRCSPTPTASGSSRPSSLPLKLTLSGDPTVTVDGRVAASWRLERAATRSVVITPHVEIRRSARAQIRAEAKRTARFCEPDAHSVEVAGV